MHCRYNNYFALALPGGLFSNNRQSNDHINSETASCYYHSHFADGETEIGVSYFDHNHAAYKTCCIKKTQLLADAWHCFCSEQSSIKILKS